MIGKRYATAVYRYCTWFVMVHDEQGWVYMCEYDDAKEDWVNCTFDTQEQAEQAAKEYNEFWND